MSYNPTVIITDNCLLIHSGIVVNQRFRLLKESVPHYSEFKVHFFKVALYNLLSKRRKKIKGDLWLIYNPWCPGYYHWLTEGLMRLMHAIDVNESGSEFKILIPENFPKYVYDSLILLGVKKDRIVSISKKYVYKIERLSVVTNPSKTADYNFELINKIRSKLFQKIQNSSNVNRPYIYISRNKANQRKVINEDQLIEALDKFGFEAVCMEDFSFEQQIQLMKTTKLLISIHGAGLTNLMFMAHKTNVIELYLDPLNETAQLSPCYEELSEVLNINYTRVLCAAAGENKDIYSGNIKVDTISLVNRVKEIIST